MNRRILLAFVAGAALLLAASASSAMSTGSTGAAAGAASASGAGSNGPGARNVVGALVDATGSEAAGAAGSSDGPLMPATGVRPPGDSMGLGANAPAPPEPT